VIISCAAGSGDASGQGGSRFLRTACFNEELAVLKIGGNVFGMRAEQRRELLVGGARIARIGALHCQTVTRERIVRFGGDEFFEHLAACFLLWLGHGLEARIIVALTENTKR